MIISDQHQYLFVELPFTASTAISKELREFYGGRSILGKHSTYREFLRFAKPEQKGYYVFSGVRNPLDEIVSLYVKYRTNPNNVYTDPEWWVTRRMIRRFRWVQEKQATFEEFLRRFYWLPYENWSSLDHDRFDFVYRLETVVDDFRQVLVEIGLPPIRDLPHLHETRGKEEWSVGYALKAQTRARWVFGPFMEHWSYSFPNGWPDSSVPSTATQLFRHKRFVKNRLRVLRGRRSHYSHERLP